MTLCCSRKMKFIGEILNLRSTGHSSIGIKSGFGDGSILSFARIADKLLSKLIVLGRDGRVNSEKKDEEKLVENMARLYFSVYDESNNEEDAVNKAKSVTESNELNPKGFLRRNGESWNEKNVESLCHRVCKRLGAHHPELINFFILKYFFPGGEFRLKGNITPRLKDAVCVNRSRIPGAGIYKSVTSGSILPTLSKFSPSLDVTKAKTAKEQLETMDVLSEKVKGAMSSLTDEALLQIYQSKEEHRSGNQANIGPNIDSIKNQLPGDTKSISKGIYEASRRAVEATLKASGFKSPTAETHPKISPTSDDDHTSAATEVPEISASNGTETSAANRYAEMFAADDAESSADNKVAETSGENNDDAKRGDLEVTVACWIITALTTDVQYRHAVEFLMPKEKKEYDEKSLADFICNSHEVEGNPKKLSYEQEVKSSDPHEVCCSWFLKLSQFVSLFVAFLKKTVLGKRNKKYWCSQNAVVTWSIFGLVLYLLFASLAAVSILVAVKSKDNGWEATEVAMNLILTGAVGIFLGTLGFETGSRQVVLDALMLQRAVEDLSKNPKHQRALLQELVGKKYPESYVKSNKSDGCTWLPREGSGWTKLPGTVSFKDIAVGGKLFICGGDMSADICGKRRRISVDEEEVLSAGRSLSPKQKALLDSHRTYVKICNKIK